MWFFKKYLMSIMATTCGIIVLCIFFTKCSFYAGRTGVTGYGMIFGYSIAAEDGGTIPVLLFSPVGFLAFMAILLGIGLSWVPKMNYISCLTFIVGAVLICFLPQCAVWDKGMVENKNMTGGFAPSVLLYCACFVSLVAAFFAVIRPFILFDDAE